jgi:hypothetical protein
MSARLNFAVAGKMTIHLDGLGFGKQLQAPTQNIKHFGVKQNELVLNSIHCDKSTNWGSMQLIDLEPWEGYIVVSIDSDDIPWKAQGRIQLYINNQLVLDDTLESGVKGPMGDPKKKKQYPIANFRS